MSSGRPPAGGPEDSLTPLGAWATVNPIFVIRPDWRRAGAPRRWPAGLGLLFVTGLIGSVFAYQISTFAVRSGFENTLETTLSEYSLAGQFVLIALFAPLLEEAIYRLAVSAPLRLNALGAAGVLGALSFVGGGVSAAVAAAVFASIAVAACVLWAQARAAGDEATRSLGTDASPPQTWRALVERWWADSPQWPVWCSIAAFGLVHLNNFEVQWSVAAIVSVPLVVSPQLWLGLMFTIARVRYGWWAGVGLHATHNLAVWGFDTALNGGVLA